MYIIFVMKQNKVAKQQTEPKRVPAMVTVEAHAMLPTLCELMKTEKGMPVNYIDAVSLSILEATEKRVRREMRRQQRINPERCNDEPQ